MPFNKVFFQDIDAFNISSAQPHLIHILYTSLSFTEKVGSTQCDINVSVRVLMSHGPVFQVAP